jgi:hypothetical protein
MRFLAISPMVVGRVAAAAALSAGCASTPRAPSVPSLPSPSASSSAPIFRFYTDEIWLNAHHFLYVLGRARNGTPDTRREAVVRAPAESDSGLARARAEERATWQEAVAFYAAGPSRKDAIFDSLLAKTTASLAVARDRESLAGVPIESSLRDALEQSMPVYRQTWWPAHRAANVAWRAETEASLDRYGRAVLDFILQKYQTDWPKDGYPVHVTGYSNWAGAYSTTGDLLVVASLPRVASPAVNLEIVFHEAMHQWDSIMFLRLRDRARQLNKRVPADLTHAMIFYTAGDAVRRVVPGHVPYGEIAGVWDRGLASFRAPLVKHWQPYLDGKTTFDQAADALIAETGPARP